MVFQYVILFNSDRELATTIHEASKKIMHNDTSSAFAHKSDYGTMFSSDYAKHYFFDYKCRKVPHSRHACM